MPYPLPPTLSPSRVTAFCDCALAYRFANLDRLPEPPSPHATKGTLVHAALELLFQLDPDARTREAAGRCLDEAAATMTADPEFLLLGLDDDATAAFVADAHRLLDGYFAMEDPTQVHAIGLELKLTAEVGGVQVTGIIDRLDRQPDGSFLVVDYKTGRAPSERYEQGKLLGVDTYALLCERVFGVRPAAVRLLYLGDGVAITCRPSDRTSRFIEQKVGAVWQSIQRANARDSFAPRPGRLCDWCAFRTWCPAFGGDPDEARRYGEELRIARRAEAARAGDDDAVPLPFPTEATQVAGAAAR
ncbi:MAG TPA: PD-(D/E)XK nuclease family protein [Planctomycetaceae bacterium]